MPNMSPNKLGMQRGYVQTIYVNRHCFKMSEESCFSIRTGPKPSGLVQSACVSMLQERGLGSCSLRRVQSLWDCFWDNFWVNAMLLRGQMTEFHMYEYLPSQSIASYTTGFGLLQSLTDLTSHTLRRWGLWDYNCFLGRMESCWKEDSEGFLISYCL